MASRHKVVKLRSKNRHPVVTPFQRPEPQVLWQVDLDNERLNRGSETVALPPKAFAVLRYLHEHSGRLVTKRELLDAVWPDIAVTEAVLKNCILKLREALGDDAKTPHYIETVHRRGYRFIGKVASEQFSVVSPPPTAPFPFSQSTGNWQLTPLVGRDSDLAQLHGCLEKALSGERQLIFITGEPGIGKTTLVEAFLMGIREQGLGVSAASLPPTILTPPVARLTPIPNPQPLAWAGPMHRAVRSRRSLSPVPVRARTTVSYRRGEPTCSVAQSTRTGVAAANARAARRCRLGGVAPEDSGGHERADVARDGRSVGGDHRRTPACVGARRLALE
jgi:DNA-binding winged helix-turn-helix (wHTH) protein